MVKVVKMKLGRGRPFGLPPFSYLSPFSYLIACALQ
jgi:hypothetical protein